jgi:serine/threonine protein kinase
MLASGTWLQNRYRVAQCIGQGGMGAIYQATDTHLHTTVALKQLLIAGAQPARAFEREALLLARLNHAALPRVTDYFTDAAGHFLVMDFIPGADMAEMLEQRGTPFPLADVLGWAVQLLDVLEYLHTHEPPIIHRDIKPHNLKLTAEGRVMLLDFGLAKGLTTIAPTAATSSMVAYTPCYAPLELVQHTGSDPRSDLYALAATLYTLLTGTPPLDVMSRAAALINGDPDPQPAIQQQAPQVPAAVADVLMQALAMRSTERPASAAAMRAALQAAPPTMPIGHATATSTTIVVAGEHQAAPPPTAADAPPTHPLNAPKQPGTPRRMPYPTLVAAAVLLVGTMLAVGLRWVLLVPSVILPTFILLFGLSLSVRHLLRQETGYAVGMLLVSLLLFVLPVTTYRLFAPLLILGAIALIVYGLITIARARTP